MKRFILAIICGALAAPGIAAQSFDCADRLSADERAICQNPDLSRLDTELSDVYEDALARSTDRLRVDLGSDQRDFVATRQACRGREDCIRRLYVDRIAELEDANAPSRRQVETVPGEVFDGRNVWAALGAVETGDFGEPLTIVVGLSRGPFDALRLRARDGGVRIRELTVVYGNGFTHRFTFRRPFRAGELSDLIALRERGSGRFIERIVIEAKGQRGARVEVIGLRNARAVGDGRWRLSQRDEARRWTESDRLDERDPPRIGGPDDLADDDLADDDLADNDLADNDLADSDRRADLDARAQTRRESERGDGTGQGVNDRAGSSEVSRVRLLDFVNTVFHRTAEMSASELSETYASDVDYYGEKRKPLIDVIRDKQTYAERWSDRAFRVREDTFRSEETSETGIYKVTYTYDFEVRGKAGESKGSGETMLLVDTNGARFVILAEEGKVANKR